MPSIFHNPKDPARIPQPGSGPGGPTAEKENRLTMLFIIVVMAIVLVIALLRVARGEERQVNLTPPQATSSVAVDPTGTA